MRLTPNPFRANSQMKRRSVEKRQPWLSKLPGLPSPSLLAYGTCVLWIVVMGLDSVLTYTVACGVFQNSPLLTISLSLLIHLHLHSPFLKTSRNTSSLSVDIFSKVDSEEIKITPSKLERGHSSRSGERSVRTLFFLSLIKTLFR